MTAKVDAFLVKIACVMPNGSVLAAARPQAARAMCTTAEPRGQLQNHVRQRRRSSGNGCGEYAYDAALCLVVRPLNLPHAAIVLVQEEEVEDVLRLLKSKPPNVGRSRGSQRALIDREPSRKRTIRN